MKKYLVIGNPINHSLSPKLHNYWIKKSNLDAIYEKLEVNSDKLEELVDKVKEKKLCGLNVTVPFKKNIIPYLDKLSKEASETQSVNTICLDGNKTVGHNTDIIGFELSIKKFDFDLKNKKVFIVGAGGVVPSLIYSLNKMNVSEIFICNRTLRKAEELKILFKNLTIINWGEIPEFDMIINATSVGLNKDEILDINFSNLKSNKIFYDVIYNPQETNFLKTGKNLGNKIINGKMMFIYQASAAFDLWHNKKPEINDDVINLLDK